MAKSLRKAEKLNVCPPPDRQNLHTVHLCQFELKIYKAQTVGSDLKGFIAYWLLSKDTITDCAK